MWPIAGETEEDQKRGVMEFIEKALALESESIVIEKIIRQCTQPGARHHQEVLVEVSARLKRCKKTKGRVKVDIFPKLVEKYSDFLTIPLLKI